MAFQTIPFIHIRYAFIEMYIFYNINNNLKVIIVDLNNTFTNKNNV